MVGVIVCANASVPMAEPTAEDRVRQIVDALEKKVKSFPGGIFQEDLDELRADLISALATTRQAGRDVETRRLLAGLPDLAGFAEAIINDIRNCQHDDATIKQEILEQLQAFAVGVRTLERQAAEEGQRERDAKIVESGFLSGEECKNPEYACNQCGYDIRASCCNWVFNHNGNVFIASAIRATGGVKKNG